MSLPKGLERCTTNRLKTQQLMHEMIASRDISAAVLYELAERTVYMGAVVLAYEDEGVLHTYILLPEDREWAQDMALMHGAVSGGELLPPAEKPTIRPLDEAYRKPMSLDVNKNSKK